MTAIADADFALWVDAARAVPVADVIAGRGIPLAGGGRDEMVGPCPVCGGTDRFSINTRKNVFFCRGSGRGGDAIALTEYLDGADFLAACETLTGAAPPRGEGTRLSPEQLAAREAERRAREAARARDDNAYREAERRRLFERFWRPASPIEGTAAAAYLALRGIAGKIPGPALRFYGQMPYAHGKGVDGAARVLHRGPALLAAITDDAGTFRGLHVTWIDLDAPKGKARVIDPDTGEVLPAKKVRGSLAGNRIMLVPAWLGDARAVYAGEGIETVLSVWSALRATGADLDAACFISGISLGNLAGPAMESVPHPTELVTDKAGHQRRQKVPGPVPDPGRPAMPIPATCEHLVLLADGDSEPFATACAMARAEARFAAPHRHVRTAWAPAGADFNDVLQGAGR